MNKDSKVILISGASRGLGLAAARRLFSKGYSVLLLMRKLPLDQGEFLRKNGFVPKKKSLQSCLLVKCDVSSAESVSRAYKKVSGKIMSISGIINNAGVLLDQRDASGTIADGILQNQIEDPHDLFKRGDNRFSKSFEVNVLGSIRVAKAFYPLLPKASFIINVSSLAGQQRSLGLGLPSYRISKAALNAATQILAMELERKRIKCIAISPGWIKTSMGGKKAKLSEEAGGRVVAGYVERIGTLKTGKFYRNFRQISW